MKERSYSEYLYSCRWAKNSCGSKSGLQGAGLGQRWHQLPRKTAGHAVFDGKQRKRDAAAAER